MFLKLVDVKFASPLHAGLLSDTSWVYIHLHPLVLAIGKYRCLKVGINNAVDRK